MGKSTLQIIFALTPLTVSWYINFAFEILLKVLCELPEACIEWPNAEAMQENSRLINTKHANAQYLDSAFGFMDGLNLPVTASSIDIKQNANYNSWLHSHVVSNVIVFSPDAAFNN
ncbi:hypothetical protein RhiTH_010428 [Rhizoctonia solani]